ncbi:neuronal PAS domain-containing protein 4-like [Antennarius striatus]|uniref:neuronal PAS domain-containing protein 4-like n=1 Tax=Antennarius striatus TaxID=241820 RepID=UPI0035B068C7
MVSHRCTKGASKARRDHINHEIKNMRALLPMALEDQERLSYLHSMAVICTYIRKLVFFKGLPAEQRSHCSLPCEAFLPALQGFILVTTAQGRLVYVSENIVEYLGLSMVDVLQGDTFYDMVESSDIAIVQSNLDIENKTSSERSFVCCMQTSKTFKMQHGSCSMMVRGRFQTFPQPSPFSSTTCITNQPLFVALCTPTVNQLQSSDSHCSSTFNSAHRMDMTFTQPSDSVLYFLGYSAEDLIGRSWYSLVHPEDLSSSAASHTNLIQADEGFQVEMVLRLQCKDLSWTWIYIQANKDSEVQGLRCTNFIISETEAKYIQTKISSNAFRPLSLATSSSVSGQQVLHAQSYNNVKCFKRQRTSNSQSEEPPGPRARRESEPDLYHVPSNSRQNHSSPAPSGDSSALYNPPFSPTSSRSPLQQEDFTCDHLIDVQGYTDQLLSSPEGSPVYYSHPETGHACHRSPSHSLSDVVEQTFDQVAFSTLSVHSPVSSSAPTCNFQAGTSDVRSVPDCLSVSNTCEIPEDCVLHHDDLCLLNQPQGSSLDQAHHVPHYVLPRHSSLLTLNQSPIPTEPNQYSNREQAEISTLAQQISSLASSFTTTHSLNPPQNVAQTVGLPSSACDWPHNPSSLSSVFLPKCDVILDGNVFSSILKDLDMATRKGSMSIPDVTSLSSQQAFSCSRNGSQPWELQEIPLGLSLTIPEDLLTAELFTVMDDFGLLLGDHNQHTDSTQPLYTKWPSTR